MGWFSGKKQKAGTENIQGILGLGAAMEEAYENMDKIEATEEEIHEYLERRLKNEIEDIKINGEKSPRLKTITNLCLKGCDIQTLLIVT